MACQLIFVRHGELAGEKKDVLHAPNDPVTLNEYGRGQIKAVAEKLKNLSSVTVFSSGEMRTGESAQIIGDRLGVKPEVHAALLGRNWGEWAGRKWEDVQNLLREKTLKERYDFVPPGGESWREFEARALAAVEHIAVSHPDQTAIIVSHGSLIRVLAPKVLGMTVEESLAFYPEYGSRHVVECHAERFTYLGQD